MAYRLMLCMLGISCVGNMKHNQTVPVPRACFSVHIWICSPDCDACSVHIHIHNYIYIYICVCVVAYTVITLNNLVLHIEHVIVDTVH